MTLDLPFSLEVDGEEKKIYCDFRDVINIFIALNDPALDENEKAIIILNNLYVDDFSTFTDLQGALNQASWFFDCGKKYDNKNSNSPKLMDWEQDYNLIVQAVNLKIKTVEDCRELPFLHWWTFISYFSERGDCQFTTIMNIREKLAKGEKLERYEQEILKENKGLILLHEKSDDEFEAELWGSD